MNIETLSPYSQDIKNAIFQILLKRVPPKKTSPHLEDIVNVLMNALSKGEVELDLNHKIDQTELKIPGWPHAHKEALLESGWLTGESAPMVLQENRLSWSRWNKQINIVVEDLLNRSKKRHNKSSHDTKQQVSNLQGTLNCDQEAAVEAMEYQRVVLLSGGPGTGKTSTVLQMLERALCINPNLKIGLAAPTGKATRRLHESLQKGVATITSPHQQSLKKIPCNTLHRWLQASPYGFAKNAQSPLSLDLLVIDEMSMVDLSLMSALLEALPQNSQLILVGDPNQLPPIGSGAIWHQLQKKNILLQFEQGAIHLRKHYRSRGEIISLSKILCGQGMHSFLNHLSHLPQSANIQLHQNKSTSIPPFLLQRLQTHSEYMRCLTQRLISKLPSKLPLSYIVDINIEKEEKELFNCLDELMILCPKRYGLWGVNEVHKAFLQNKLEQGLSNWPQGTPVMCNENQPDLELSNGDIGIVIGEGGNRRVIFRIFPEGGKSATKFIHPARLKTIEPAFAMTIHKAQGSETNEVILLLPEEYSQSHTYEKANAGKSYEERLLYTAITRAKNNVTLIIRP